jgi:hypothetical protein
MTAMHRQVPFERQVQMNGTREKGNDGQREPDQEAQQVKIRP